MNMLTAALSNKPPARDSRELWKHFSDTYFSLRLALALFALSMPFVLWLCGSYFHGMDLRASMSGYFWAAETGSQCASFPMRTYFVGFLFAIAICLYAYKGLTPLENNLLNLASLCALLVSLVPERLALADAEHDPQVKLLFETCPAVSAWASDSHLPIHFIAAVTLFVLLAVVAWFCANKSLEYLPPERNQAWFRCAYKVIAFAMLLFPAIGLVVAYMLGSTSDKIFFIEALGIITFSIYWIVKTVELSLSRLEYDPAKALEFAMQREAIVNPKRGT